MPCKGAIINLKTIKMNKQLFYKYANGKQATYYPNGWNKRESIIKDIDEQIRKNNEKVSHEYVTYCINNNAIEISNGEFLILPKHPFKGEIKIHSQFITIGGCRIEKKDISNCSINACHTYGGLLEIEAN